MARALLLVAHMKRTETGISSETGPGAAANAREVTLVFCDIAAFTQFTEEQGDLASYRVVKSCHQLVRELVGRLGGELLELRGDGFLFAFDSAAEATVCSLAIQQAVDKAPDLPIRLRIGLHTGLAIHDEEGYYGRTVIAAFRVSSLAQPDEILVSEVTRQQLPSADFRFGRGRSVKLKGLTGPCRVWRVQWREALDGFRPHLGTGGAPGVPRIGSSESAEAGAIGLCTSYLARRRRPVGGSLG